MIKITDDVYLSTNYVDSHRKTAIFCDARGIPLPICPCRNPLSATYQAFKLAIERGLVCEHRLMGTYHRLTTRGEAMCKLTA
jgi:hypothetical protein